MIVYRYVHKSTEATTGYFACEPEPAPSLEEALAHLVARPLDDFMRRHVVSRMAALAPDAAAEALQKAAGPSPAADFPPALLALAAELALLDPALREQPFFAKMQRLAGAAADAASTPAADSTTDPAPSPAQDATSLVWLGWARLPDKEAHQAWGRVVNANILQHRSLKDLPKLHLPPLYAAGANSGLPGTAAVFSAPFSVPLPGLFAEHAARSAALEPGPLPPAEETSALAEETSALAEERLRALDIITGEEMRHTASLSPVALLRPWNVRLRVRCGRHDFSLHGRGTTYGRGLSVAGARVSCLMEMVERASVYLSVEGMEITERPAPCPLVYGRRTDILEKHGPALDPNDFPLESPYLNEPLYWLHGHGPGRTAATGADCGVNIGAAPVFVPVQMAGLFCNLDERALFDAPGSTGIGAGRSMEQAKIAALLEIVERDAEAVNPFVKASCFMLAADANRDPLLASLLADYAARGINVQFQDLTGPLGIPVYKCFVMNARGAVFRGHGAGLSGRGAALSALTETPFPYPDGGPSGPMLRKLPTRFAHELPEFTLPAQSANLALLEDLLTRNGRAPVYVDLTRAGLDFPVVRAFIPGLELGSDRDAFSRVPRRLYEAALALTANG